MTTKSRGRPPTPNGEARVLVSGPASLLAAVAERAEKEQIPVREAWRRAARLWLLPGPRVEEQDQRGANSDDAG